MGRDNYFHGPEKKRATEKGQYSVNEREMPGPRENNL